MAIAAAERATAITKYFEGSSEEDFLVEGCWRS
jgi:hypothetical protein